MITCFIVVILIYAADSVEKRHFLLERSLIEGFWFIYIVLISQNNSRVDPLMGKWGVNAIWIVGCFMLGTTILVSLYESELTTSMTTVIYPFIPLTLEDVAESGIPIISAGKSYYGGNLEYQINNAITLGIYGKNVSSILGKLKRNIFLPGESAYPIGRKISQQDELYEYNTTKELNTKGKTLAIMDAMWHTDGMLDGIASSPSIIVFQGREVLSFKEDLMWVLRRNFFTKLYQKSWAGIIEGGFPERFYHMGKLKTVKLRGINFGRFTKEYFLRILFKDPQKKKLNDEFASVNQESVRYCYYIFLLILSFAIVTFGVELRVKLRNNVISIAPVRKNKIVQCKRIFCFCYKRKTIGEQNKGSILKSLCYRSPKPQLHLQKCVQLKNDPTVILDSTPVLNQPPLQNLSNDMLARVRSS